MSSAYYLGLDVGTQSTKALVIDEESGQIVARAASAYELIEGLPPGCAEQHPETWWQAVRACLAALAAQVDLRRVRALGVSGQQHGFVALDGAASVLRAAKLWCDTSTSSEAEELAQRLGRSVPVGFTASKILWMKRHEPAHFARLQHVLLPHDWINFRLTGVLAMEAGDASGTGFFDSADRAFDARAMRAIDDELHAKLPPLLAPQQALGVVRDAIADELGLPRGVLVAPGSGDNMCAAIGSGATCAGVAVLSLGTSATLFTRLDHPMVDPQGLIADFCDATGAWLALLCVMNATGVLHEVAAAFEGHDLQSLTEAARAVPAGADGLLCVPFLQGERVPALPRASGSLLGWRPGLLTPGHVFRAALEGINANLACGLQRMCDLGMRVDELRLIGGGAQNDFWVQLLADALELPIQRLEEHEAAALGAALQARWVAEGGGDLTELVRRHVAPRGARVEPDGARARFYRQHRKRFLEAVEGTAGISR